MVGLGLELTANDSLLRHFVYLNLKIMLLASSASQQSRERAFFTIGYQLSDDCVANLCRNPFAHHHSCKDNNKDQTDLGPGEGIETVG